VGKQGVGWFGGMDGVLQGGRAQQEALAVIARWATRSRHTAKACTTYPPASRASLQALGDLTTKLLPGAAHGG
jgi:hypothetical protein